MRTTRLDAVTWWFDGGVHAGMSDFPEQYIVALHGVHVHGLKVNMQLRGDTDDEDEGQVVLSVVRGEWDILEALSDAQLAELVDAAVAAVLGWPEGGEWDAAFREDWLDGVGDYTRDDWKDRQRGVVTAIYSGGLNEMAIRCGQRWLTTAAMATRDKQVEKAEG